jgi:hypothetical protein
MTDDRIRARHPGQAQAATLDPAARRAAMRRALVKLAVGCLLTMLTGGIVMKYKILSMSSSLIAVVIQITAFVVYFTTSDIMSGYQVPEQVRQRDVLGPERRAARRRTGIRFVTCLMLAFLGIASFQRYNILAYPPPWKQIDPASRLFEPLKFRFPDYRSSKELEHAAQTMFPAGAPKTTVDRILHDAGHATVETYSQGANYRVMSYSYSSSAMRGFLPGVFAWAMSNREADQIWYIFVKYNPRDQVIGISATVQLDDSGALPYTQITPVGTTSPYAPPSALQMKP